MSGPHTTPANTTAVLQGDRPVNIMITPDLWCLEADMGRNIIELTASQRAELREVLDNE